MEGVLDRLVSPCFQIRGWSEDYCRERGFENVEADQWLWSVLLRGKVPCVMPQSVHQSSGERGSSNDDQVKKQAALDGAHVESFDRLCEVINKTADVTNCKSGEAERHFSKLRSESEKLMKKLKNCEAYKGLLGFDPFGHYRQLAGRFDSFLIFNRNNELGEIVNLVVRTKSMMRPISWELKF